MNFDKEGSKFELNLSLCVCVCVWRGGGGGGGGGGGRGALTPKLFAQSRKENQTFFFF